MAGPIDYDKALLDPGSQFGSPEELRGHPDLTEAQKIELLRRWQYDANEVAVAGEEGMPGEARPLLRRIVLALEELTGGASGEHTSPTKQDGG